MKSPFGNVLIMGSGSIVLPIIHSNDNDVTVLNAFTFGKPTWKTIPRTELEEISEAEYSRFHTIQYSNPTYRYTGSPLSIFGDKS